MMSKIYNISETGSYGVIYLLTSPSGKYYIGQSWNIKKRWSYYKYINYGLRTQPYLFRAIKKYGPKNFKYEIIDLADNQIELDNKETEYIKIYDSLDKNKGYNLSSGGQGKRTLTQEQKNKISESNKGKKASLETIKKLQESHKDQKMPLWLIEKLRKLHTGVSLSKEHRKKIGNSNFGKLRTEEAKIKQSKKKLKYIYTLIDPNGIIHETNNLWIFSKLNNLNAGHMGSIASGKMKSYKNWRIINKKDL